MLVVYTFHERGISVQDEARQMVSDPLQAITIKLGGSNYSYFMRNFLIEREMLMQTTKFLVLEVHSRPKSSLQHYLIFST